MAFIGCITVYRICKKRRRTTSVHRRFSGRSDVKGFGCSAGRLHNPLDAQVHQRADMWVSDVAVDPCLVQLAKNGPGHNRQALALVNLHVEQLLHILHRHQNRYALGIKGTEQIFAAAAAGARAVAALDVHGRTPIAARGLQELAELGIGRNKKRIGHSYLLNMMPGGSSCPPGVLFV